jgi:hypothetical protein
MAITLEQEIIHGDECGCDSCQSDNPFKTATDPDLLACQRQDSNSWVQQRTATRDRCNRCGNFYDEPSPLCVNYLIHGGRLEGKGSNG